MKKAFTLIEIVVAVAILAMVLGFSSMAFRTCIDAYRVAGANSEIMQKLRAITDQLNADFKGVILKYGGRVVFKTEGSPKVRGDSIAFFANGDFQSTDQYDDPNRTVAGNVATIFYGLTNNAALNPKEKILVRRQTILTADEGLSDLPASREFKREYLKISLSKWRVDPPAPLPQDPADWDDWTQRPNLNTNSGNDLVMYLAKGVDNFTIQYVGLDDLTKSGTKEFNEWRPVDDDEIKDVDASDIFRPLAFKFSFKLYDSKGIIKGGRAFSHIIWLEPRH